MRVGSARRRASSLRIAEQREHAVADEVGGGLVARDEQQAEHVQHLLPGEDVAFLLRLHEGAHDVILGFRAPGLDDGPEVVAERLPGLGPDRALPRADRRLEEAGALVRPDPEPRPVLRPHPQHLRDHDDRQRIRHRLHEIEAGRVHLVQQGVREAADLRLQGVDRPPGERLVDEGAQPGVVRRVEEQHGVVVGGGHHGLLPAGEVALGRVVGEAPVVAEDGVHVRVAGEHPSVQQPAAVHGASLAQLRVLRVRVLRHPRGQRVVGRPAPPALGHQQGIDGQ